VAASWWAGSSAAARGASCGRGARLTQRARPAEDDGVQHQSPSVEETGYTLSQAGRLIDVLEQCLAARLTPRRSGWSTATHLGWDLERHFGVRAPIGAIERAMRTLVKRRVVRLSADDAGLVWYRLRDS
jgi:hypothetical protein